MNDLGFGRVDFYMDGAAADTMRRRRVDTVQRILIVMMSVIMLNMYTALRSTVNCFEDRDISATSGN